MNSSGVQPAFAPSITPLLQRTVGRVIAVLREARTREQGRGVRAADIKARSIAHDMPGSGSLCVKLA